jgi:hypothetical protein
MIDYAQWPTLPGSYDYPELRRVLRPKDFPGPPAPRKLDPQDQAFKEGWESEIASVGTFDALRITLYFPHNGSSLLATHMSALDQLAARLRSSMWLEMYSVTDRTGSQAVNYRVSRERLAAVQSHLLMRSAPRHLVAGPQNKYFGEDFIATLNAPDNYKWSRYRSVNLYIWIDISTSRYIFADRPLIQYGRSHRQP